MKVGVSRFGRRRKPAEFRVFSRVAEFRTIARPNRHFLALQLSFNISFILIEGGKNNITQPEPSLF